MDSNSKAYALASRLVKPKDRRTASDEEDDEDAIFAELEEEIENDSSYSMREHAFAAFKRDLDTKKEMEASHHGRYTEITDEKEVIQVTAREHRSVVHFYHSNFKRCELMDKHLAKLAPKYFGTRFIRVFVENVPWLVERLGIKVLPCVISFIDGVSADKLIGFEALGNTDEFDTLVLEMRLLASGAIEKPKPDPSTQLFRVKSTNRPDSDDEVFDL